MENDNGKMLKIIFLPPDKRSFLEEE